MLSELDQVADSWDRLAVGSRQSRALLCLDQRLRGNILDRVLAAIVVVAVSSGVPRVSGAGERV